MQPRFRPGVEHLERLQLLSSDLSQVITADQTSVTPGTPIHLTLTVTNHGTQPEEYVDYVGEGFSIDQNGLTVWSSDPGPRSVLPMFMELAPGQSITREATWDDHANDSQGNVSPSLATGAFQVYNNLIIGGLPAAPLTLQVGPPPAAPDVSMTITSDRASYTPGMPVVLTLTITDIGSSDVMFGDGPSIDGFFANQQTLKVWSSNAGFNPFFVIPEDLKPGQSYALQATWDGHPNNLFGDVSPYFSVGTFEIRNELEVDGVTAAPLSVTIAPASTPPRLPGGVTQTLPPVTTTTTPPRFPGGVVQTLPPVTTTTTPAKLTPLQVMAARLAQRHAWTEALLAANAQRAHAVGRR